MSKVTIKGWVARDKDGKLNLFSLKPTRENDKWGGCVRIYLPDDFFIPRIFQNITWESGPVEKTLTIE